MNTRRVLAAPLLPLILACQSVQPVPVEFIPHANPALVYLVDARGRTQGVVGPRLSGDTVLGLSLEGNRPVAVPLRQVELVATLRPDHARTVLLVGGLTALGALVSYAVLTHSRGDGSEFCDYDNQPMVGGATECGYPGDRPGQLVR